MMRRRNDAVLGGTFRKMFYPCLNYLNALDNSTYRYSRYYASCYFVNSIWIIKLRSITLQVLSQVFEASELNDIKPQFETLTQPLFHATLPDPRPHFAIPSHTTTIESSQGPLLCLF